MQKPKLYIPVFAESKAIAVKWAKHNNISQKQFESDYLIIRKRSDIDGRYFAPGAIRLTGGYKFQTPEIMEALEIRTITQEPQTI